MANSPDQTSERQMRASSSPQQQDSDREESQCGIAPNWWAIVAAVILVLLATVSKFTLGKCEFTGGAPLIGLAALVLLWPLIRQLATRGGSTEFLGLKIQVNALERRTEEQYGVALEELRADVEELRARLATPVPSANMAVRAESDSTELHAFQTAVAKYRVHQDLSAWKSRTETDKYLIARPTRLSARQLSNLLRQAPDDQETAMAAAVSLGSSLQGEDDNTAAELLVTLLKNPFERARYRAARSIERRARRTDTSPRALDTMLRGVRAAMDDESAEVVMVSLRDAKSALMAKHPN